MGIADNAARSDYELLSANLSYGQSPTNPPASSFLGQIFLLLLLLSSNFLPATLFSKQPQSAAAAADIESEAASGVALRNFHLCVQRLDFMIHAVCVLCPYCTYVSGNPALRPLHSTHHLASWLASLSYVGLARALMPAAAAVESTLRSVGPDRTRVCVRVREYVVFSGH